MKNDFPPTYTSPLTGKTYDIVYRTNGFARYDIELNGKKVQFGLVPSDIPGQVAHYEGVSDGWTSSPRD